MPQRTSYQARWVFPVSAPALENGVVEIEAGKITAVHDRPDPNALDLGNVALLPGLVNAHTHLEFSELTVPIAPAQPFTAWIRALVTQRRTETPNPPRAIAHGHLECRSTGTTTIGEIATENWSAPALQATGCRTVVFRELLGLPAARGAAQLQIARSHLARAAELAHGGLIAGLSPHAPYSVHPQLFRDLVDLAATHDAPVAMHLAETQAELELLAHGTGEFVDLLRDFGVWEPDALPHPSRPLDYLRTLAALRRALVIHGNYLKVDEWEFLAANRQISVVYCPRTHAYFGHSPHPWQELLARGAAVAIGTDSRGSNPDLNLWRELQFLQRQFPHVDPALLLQLGTLNGARALGLDQDTGSLTPGKRADLALVELPAGRGIPYELLFAGEIRNFTTDL